MAEDTSILSEIDEALRADRAQQFWSRHGNTLILCCALAIMASVASALWKSHLKTLHEGQTTQLAQAATLEETQNFSGASALYEKVESGGGALAALAGIRHAHALVMLNEKDKAAALYGAVAKGELGNGPQALRDFAALEEATLTGNPAKTQGIFADSAAEIDAVRTREKGTNAEARTKFSSIVANDSASLSQRTRAQLFLDATPEEKK